MPHIEPTAEASAQLAQRGLTGEVVMLNLLRFREQADYSRSPELAPAEPVSGERAYRSYARGTGPLLAAAGGEVVFAGSGGTPLIGPSEERWDVVLLVRYPDLRAFMSFTADPAYLAVVGHRTAALEDSRLLPLTAGAEAVLGRRG